MCISDRPTGGADVGAQDVAARAGRNAPAGAGQGSVGCLRAPPDLELALVGGRLRELAKATPLLDRVRKAR
eukprot:7116535-Alexandrium_andersonii.AAC.1